MYGTAAGDSTAHSDRTAFRKAEKKYKLYKSPSLKPRLKQTDRVLSTDLSDVVDFEAVLGSCLRGEELPEGTYQLPCPGFPLSVFCFRDRPGFYFIPRALSIEEQCHWIEQSLTSFPQPPNRTNHTAIYGPIHDLFSAAQNQKVLVAVESLISDVGHGCDSNRSTLGACRYEFTESVSSAASAPCKPIPAAVLLRKLRWSTLGLQFDWSKRNYNVSLPHNKIPDLLCELSKKMAAPAMSSGEEFQPEGAIVNYFGPSDMLGGHLDDMEVDWSKPIVSISLGCKAIFLLGGKSREDIPVAMFLRSGDVVLMAGEARECFHGVPRIFTVEENADVSPLLSNLSTTLRDYMTTSRININIRQVN